MKKPSKSKNYEVNIHARLLASFSTSIQRALIDSCKRHGYTLKIYKRWPTKSLLTAVSKNATHLLIVSVEDVATLTAGTRKKLPFHNFILIPTVKNTANTDVNPEEASAAQKFSHTLLAKLESIRYLIGTKSPDFFESMICAVLAFHRNFDNPSPSSELANYFIDKSKLKTSRLTLSRSTQRAEMQNLVQKFFDEQIGQSRAKLAPGISSYPKNISDVLDEFLMNAIWDANPHREHLARNVPTQLDENESVEIECGFDGTYLTLSVVDAHGTFPARALRGPIRYALGIKETAKLNEGPGGAGLGLYMVLQKVAALAFEIERGQTTRATAVLRADTSLREMQRQPRSLLMFDKSNGLNPDKNWFP